MVMLTPREQEVLWLIASGCTIEEAAAQMGCARETARKHLLNVERKLGAKTRIHAVALAMKKGLISMGIVG